MERRYLYISVSLLKPFNRSLRNLVMWMLRVISVDRIFSICHLLYMESNRIIFYKENVLTKHDIWILL
jgi:hypothetical protein